MGPPQGPYILQLCMGPSYFWGGLTPPDPPLFRTLVLLLVFMQITRDLFAIAKFLLSFTLQQSTAVPLPRPISW